MTNNKPTIAELIAGVKEHFDLEVDASQITDEIYEKATKSAERGASMRAMASTLRYYLLGKAKEESSTKEVIPGVKGVFVGSKDIASKTTPIGKNKSSSTFLLSQGDDNKLRLFTDPNTPSMFGRIKESLFGPLMEMDLTLTPAKTGDRVYTSPKDEKPLDKKFEIDTGMIEAYDSRGVASLEDYSDCAFVGTIRNIKLTPVPPWEQSEYNTEEYPMFVGGRPVFTIYMESEEGEPVVKCMSGVRHLSVPFIDIEDFDIMYDEAAFDNTESKDSDYAHVFDSEAIDAMGDYLSSEVTPMFSGRKVVIFGTKMHSNDVSKTDDDGNPVTTTFVDMSIAGMMDVGNEPNIIEVMSAKDKVKAAKAAKSKKAAPKKNVEADKMAKRKELVGKVVTAMRDATNVQLVREMNDEIYFIGVEDEVILEMIQGELEAQGIVVPDEPDEEPEQEFEPEAEVETPEEDDDIRGDE